MSLASYCLLFLGAFVAVSQAQYDYPVHPFDYFRSGGYSPYPSYSGYGVEQRQSSNQPDARFFFTTLTLTLTTTTSTSTFTTSTTCTTSTTTLSTCTPGKRRRRGTQLNAGLFHNEDEEENIFTSIPKKTEEEKLSVLPEPSRPAREFPVVPYVVQPGFRSTDSAPLPRFLLAFGTSTSTTTTTSTYTATLTAICSSSTSYSTCGSSGK